MSDLEPQELERSEAAASFEPGMRFPLRAMLLLTTGLALLAATIGPLYRQAHPEARSSVLVFWMGVLTALASFGLLEWRRAIRRKQVVGQVRFQLKRVNRPGESIFMLLCAWGVLLYCIFMAYAMTHSFGRFQGPSSPGAASIATLNIMVFIGGASIGAYMVAAIDYVTRPWTHSGRVDIGETGFMLDCRATRWSQVRYAAWHDDYPNRLVLQYQTKTCQSAVPSAIRAEVEAFVRTKAVFLLAREPVSPQL